jgi:GMP synthase-like glutamine amidotransferase
MILCIDLSFRPDSLSLTEFVNPIAAIVRKTGEEAEIKHYLEMGTDLPSDADAVILCGTALKDCEYFNRLDSFCWLSDACVPVLGICAGMQVLSTIYGGRAESICEIGTTEVKVIQPDELFSGKDRFHAYELHSLACTVPSGFNTLAVSDLCVQAIRHCDKAVYGVMFHPEVRNEWVVERFIKMVKIE